MYSCDNCKANKECSVAVEPGSVVCMVNRLRYGGTHADNVASRQAGDFCQFCGHRLRTIGGKRFCNNVNCKNRYVYV